MIYEFNAKKVPALNQVGGKAKALIETTNAGFPVPEGIVLSVEFFGEWIDEIKKSHEWESLIKEVTQSNCDVIKEKAENIEFTPTQRKTLDKYLTNIKGKIFAVRSSSPEEDLEGTSFAGMYETFLGVTKDKLEEFIKKAFSSCFDFRVMEYKKQNNILLDNTAIAVIIQRQIVSDVSGVGFSLNPLNNAYDEVVINASFGLGEAIVSGLVTPDTYIYDFLKNKVIDKQINDKKIALWLMKDGGLIEKENTEPSKQALSDELIVELAKLIKECEQFYNKPIDTEWAYENGKLYLLQSRPITTYLPLYPELITEPGKDKLLYLDILSITQGFEDPLSVLGSDIWSKMMITSGGGVLTCTPDGTSPILHGRQYFNIFYLYKALGKAVGNSYIYGHDESVRKIMETIDEKEFTVSKYPESTKGAKLAMVKMGEKFIGPTTKSIFGDYNNQIIKYLEIFNNATKRADKYNHKDLFSETVKVALVDISEVIYASGMLMAGVMASNKLKKMFKDSNVETELAALGMELKGNPTSEMGRLMFKMASFNEFQNTKSKEEFSKLIEEKAYSKEFMNTFNEFIKKHGVRCFKEIDIASKRAYEDMGELYNRLKEININDSQITKVKQKKKEAYEKLYSIAKEGGFAKKFKKQVNIFQATFGYREYPKYSSVTFIAKLREVVLKIAEGLVLEGRLNNVSEVFDLTIDDISLAQKDSSVDLQKLRNANLKPYRSVTHIKDWPIMIDSRGKIYKPKLEIKNGDLIGTSIAPGNVVGKVKVLNFPYEKPLNPGEILVTKSTEPSWTPIFINASGIVMEVGGPLQHGGIIAREYGIPCVSGLVGIMDMVNDGDIIEVDGTNGVVRILDKCC